MRYAILLDGGFIKQKLGTKSAPIGAKKIISLTESIKASQPLESGKLHRIYYYDSPPLFPPNCLGRLILKT